MNIKDKARLFAKKFNITRKTWHLYQSFIYFVKHPFPSHNKRNREGVVIQLLNTFANKDAIGNAAIELSKMLDNKNIINYIVYEGSRSYIENGVPIHNFKFNKKDIVIYHMSKGCNASNVFKRINVKKKILYYHNITPSKYFFDMPLERKMSEIGRKQLVELKDCADLALCVSEYNAKELKAIGYKNINVVGIPSRIDELLKYKSKKLNNRVIKILTVGRISRNKCIEDVIKIFHELYKLDNEVELNIVGSCTNKLYEKQLRVLINNLNLTDKIYFISNISEKELAFYYSNANAYICMSEHEGFCVPLVEAMAFNIPIFAFDSTAIKETLGDYGFVYDKKDYFIYANKILNFIKSNYKIISARYTVIKEKNKNQIERFIKCLSK